MGYRITYQALGYFPKGKGKFMNDKEEETSLHGRNNRDIVSRIFPGRSDRENEKLVIEKETICQNLVKKGAIN